ncbi:MAG: hypothetical protein L0287_32940 [Anaerolineae bacterium]|nr:hypothetical protein [Anaerolineae bacterium]
MKSGILFVLGFIAILALGAASQNELAQLRNATAEFHRTSVARAAGYDLVPGLDYCFQNYGVGGMGYHFINVSLLDTTVDLTHPEAIVYAPAPNGGVQLGAVEYVVPAAAWDAEGHTHLPMLFGQHFHLNEALGVYILHVWVWKNNPSGMFEDWNPDVSCPALLNLEVPFRGR